MDAANTFQTPTTARVAQGESLGMLLVSAVLLVLHLGHVHWLLFAVLFLVIDVVGYLPGMIAYRRSPDGSIDRIYYLLYNVMHCYLTWTVLLGVATLVWGWQWAFLAVPLHLLGDRGLFGNSVKSFVVPFEPVPLPQFSSFRSQVQQLPRPWQEPSRGRA